MSNKDEPQFNYKMVIAYDGTRYSGWQIQPNGNSIQENLQDAIQVLVKHPVTVTGSGRTDAGVHALGQTAHFKTNAPVDLFKFHRSVNALIPHDIRVRSIQEAPLDFHAQYSAISKTYYYHLHLDSVENPFQRLYSWHLHQKIDLEMLQEAAKRFIGTHDFTSFANEAHRGCAAHDPVRTLQRLDIIPEEGGVRLEFQADGFLYKMVRNITGTLIDAASHKIQPEEISRILEKKDRRQAGAAVPPHGLFLIKVEYPEDK